MPFEVVDGREAVRQPAGVGEHDRAERTEGQLVPEEPEAVLAGRAEQVEHDVVADADAAEVHRDRRGPLALHAGEVVGADAGVGEDLLGLQRHDLADRATSVVLPTPKPPAIRILIAVGTWIRRCRGQSDRRPWITALRRSSSGWTLDRIGFG